MKKALATSLVVGLLMFFMSSGLAVAKVGDPPSSMYAFADVNGNGLYDPGVDEPAVVNDHVDSSGYHWIEITVPDDLVDYTQDPSGKTNAVLVFPANTTVDAGNGYVWIWTPGLVRIEPGVVMNAQKTIFIAGEGLKVSNGVNLVSDLVMFDICDTGVELDRVQVKAHTFDVYSGVYGAAYHVGEGKKGKIWANGLNIETGSMWINAVEDIVFTNSAILLKNSTDPNQAAEGYIYADGLNLGWIGDSKVARYKVDLSNTKVGGTVYGFSSFGRPMILEGTRVQSSWFEKDGDLYMWYLDGKSCVSANPTVSISPERSQPTKAGTAVTYAVSVTNNDSPACAAASFSLQARVPDGWASALAPTLSLDPGASTTTTFTVTSAASAANGPYPVGVTAKNSALPDYTASASAAYVVSNDSQPVTVSTDRPVYSPNQKAAITVTVMSGGRAVQGARAVITVRRPDGSVAGGMTPRTGADGTAKVVGFRPNKIGTYEVKAVVDKNGAVLGSGKTNFTAE